MLTFAAPWMLLGTLLIAVPVVLHLVMRQQPRHLEFPALRFIRQKREQNRRRLRLRHLLLLLLRCAVIALLALALAHPKLTSSVFSFRGQGPVAAVFLFDTGPNMAYQNENKTRLREATEAALWLLPQLPADSEVAVLDSRPWQADFSVDRAAARAQLEKLSFTSIARPLADGMQDAAALLKQSELERKEIYIFTDLSSRQWLGSNAAQWKKHLSGLEDAAVYVFDVGVAEAMNYSLAPVELSNEILSKNATLHIRTELMHDGPGGSRTVELHLLDNDGASQKRNEISVQTTAEAAAPVEMQIAGLEVGTHHGFLKITGQDGLPGDDMLYFSVHVASPWRMLLAAPQPVSRYTEFVAGALVPPDFRQSGQARLEIDTVPLDQLEEEALSAYDAVWILDPTPMPVSLWQKLSGYVASGGGLAIALGRNAQPIDSFNEAAAQELLPAPLQRPWRTDGQVFLAPRREHAVVRPFQEFGSEIPWNEFPIAKFWQLATPQDDSVSTIISLSNGQPAILERVFPPPGGKVLTLTTSLSDAPTDARAWNYLLSGLDAWPGFILTNELALYLVGSVDERLNYEAGETVQLRLETEDVRDAYLLYPPSDADPNQPADEASKIVPNRTSQILDIRETDLPGHYRLAAGGAKGVRRGFSVNLPEGATALARASDEQWTSSLGEQAPTVVRDRTELTKTRRVEESSQAGLIAYPWIILLLVILVAGEQLVSGFFYRQSGEGSSAGA